MIYTCLGQPFHLEDLEKENPVYWTIHKNAKPGDVAVFYLTNPISSIVSFGKVLTTPYLVKEGEWKDKYFAEILTTKIFNPEEFISNKLIRQLFPEWRYWLQPRQSNVCPSAIEKTFLELLKRNYEQN